MNWLDGTHWVLAAGWFGFTLYELRCVRRIPALPGANDGQKPGPRADAVNLPRITAVIAARDEVDRIADTVRGLLAQRGVDLRVVVADDRSMDRTGEVVDAIAREDKRVSRVRIDTLPAGWLGKCHACHLGAERALADAKDEDWLLFTDADITLAPGVLERAAAEAARAGADHLVLTPSPRRSTFWSRAVMVGMNKLVLLVGGPVNAGDPRAYIGIGAFNLVRAAAYRAVGGHERLRLEVVDDMKLGLLLRREGFASRCCFGAGQVRADWGASVGQIVRLLEKNQFAAMGFSLPRMFGAVVLFVAGWGGAALAPMSLRPAGFAAFAGLASTLIPGLAVCRRAGAPMIAGVLSPLCMPVLVWSAVNSTVRTLARGGVRWRETFYPLATLREGLRTLEAGLPAPGERGRAAPRRPPR